MDDLLEYQNQNVFDPKYLFHGTAHEIEKLECEWKISNLVFISLSLSKFTFPLYIKL